MISFFLDKNRALMYNMYTAYADNILEVYFMGVISVIAPLIVIVFYFLIFIIALLTSLISSIIYGVMIGLIPLVSGFMNGKKGLGTVGLFVCFAAYWMLGLFPALLVCLLFVFLTIKEKKVKPVNKAAIEANTEE